MNIVKSALNLFGITKGDDGGSKGTVVSLDEFLTELPSLLGYDISFARHQKDDGSHHVEVSGGDGFAVRGVFRGRFGAEFFYFKK